MGQRNMSSQAEGSQGVEEGCSFYQALPPNFKGPGLWLPDLDEPGVMFSSMFGHRQQVLFPRP